MMCITQNTNMNQVSRIRLFNVDVLFNLINIKKRFPFFFGNTKLGSVQQLITLPRTINYLRQRCKREFNVYACIHGHFDSL